MNQEKITIISTSYLIPNHYSWSDQFDKSEILNFEFINNFSSGFYKSSKNSLLFCKIFINDLIDDNKNYSKKDFEKVINTIVKLINYRLKTSNNSLIIFISNRKKNNIFDQLSIKNTSEIFFEMILNRLIKISKKKTNLIILNFNNIIENSNYDIFDERNWYLANCRLSSDGLELVAKNLNIIYKKLNNPSKKVLILDCDNTLWGGIIGEDGIDNILLGQDGIGKAFLDFQKRIKLLSLGGTLLCISSKNNLSDVMEVFSNHNQMQIKKKDILIIKANWKEKYLNIKEIASELNLSMDSMVFWDDNPLERNKIRKFLPEVFVVEPDAEVTNWPKQLNEIDLFSKIKVTKEDKNKLEQYKIRSKFINEKNEKSDEIKYLQSIKLKPKFISLNKDNIARAAQMTQKTNQFNLRTKRYSISDIQKLSRKKDFIINLVELKDMYGDHGIVGLIILKKIKKKTVFIDTFLISCRVFGRYLETWMMYQIKKRCSLINIVDVYGEHIMTSKNKNICIDFYNSHSFKKIKLKDNFIKNDGQVYFSNIKKIKNDRIKIYDK